MQKTALEIWKDALTNVMPHVEVRSRRVGGATFQIPMQIVQIEKFLGYEMDDSLCKKKKRKINGR